MIEETMELDVTNVEAPRPLDERDILSIISAELSEATYSYADSSTAKVLEDSLAYYLGAPNGREVDGKSQVTSTDVADAIEWILPQIMESFTKTNEVVMFDPVRPGDERQAEIESEYIYDVVMKQNNGFIAIHEFVKDALIQRNGVIKVWYEKQDETTTSSFSGLNEMELTALLNSPGVQLIGQEQNEFYGTWDVNVSITNVCGRVRVTCIPLEEFRVSARHNSVNLDDAPFTAHVVQKTVSELILDGYPREVLENLSDYSEYQNRQDYRFAYQGEDTSRITLQEDPSRRLIEISECYLRIDVNGDGIAEFMKITVAGSDNATELLAMEEVDSHPWISTTAILMSHKFQGLSIYDRLKEIQDQKTSLWRNIFDNLYLQNNQRTSVLEGQVNVDDLLVSRPGGIVRVKNQDAIRALVNPPLSPESYQMLGYLDEVRAGRTGVSPEGNATPIKIGSSIGSQGVERLLTSKEALVGLIIRVIAETGIKPLYVRVRDLVMQHTDSIQDFQFRGQWVKVNPSEWQKRIQCTVRVGTGTGDTAAKTAALQTVMGIQEKLLASGMPGIEPSKIYAALDDYCKLTGLNGANRYFMDPTSPEGQQALQQHDQGKQVESQKNDQMQQAIAQSQMQLAQAETQKAAAQMQNVQVKAQYEQAKAMLATQKSTYEAQLNNLEQELKQAQAMADEMYRDRELKLKYDEMELKYALEITKLEAQAGRDFNASFEDNTELVEEDEGDKDNESEDRMDSEPEDRMKTNEGAE